MAVKTKKTIRQDSYGAGRRIIGITCDDAFIDRIAVQAREEKRKVSVMARLLIEEALNARDASSAD